MKTGSPERQLALPDRRRDPRRSWLRACLSSRLLAPACVLVVAAATYALFQFVILSRVPHAVLGKWLVREGGDMHGAILEFRRDGTMIATVNMQGKAAKIVAQVEVEDETMRTTSRHPITGKEHTDVQTIRKLTDEEFVFEDSKGTVIRMERLRE